MSFVHLHVHSEYSLLDGFSNLQKLTARAKEMGMPAIALTDHGVMYGVVDFYNAALSAGVKPLIGVEIYLAARGMKEREPQEDKKSSHLLLLAENETGYQNLLQIASAAQLEGFYYYPRIDHDFLAAHAEGLICTSGCMAAEIPRLIQQDNLDAARRQLDWYFSVFGRDRFFLELQKHEISALDAVNKTLLEMGPRYRAQYVATNDVHYINPDEARLQDILLAIQTGCVLSDPKRMRMTDNTYYLRTPAEMARLFAEVPETLNNTLLIAERCNLDLGFKGYHLPPFEVPPGFTAETYLRKLCEEGLLERYGARAAEALYRQRLHDELNVIHSMGFDTYFLIVWDLCRYSREQGIWYNARGSAAGSIVAYTLDITLVDPIEHNLIFERFLNPGRISMPDIDLDFRDDRRAEMLEYTARKYGDDKVAQIITFGTLGARAAIRDVGRVMDIPLNEVDKAAKLVPNIPGKPVSLKEALETVPDFKKLYDSTVYYKELIDTAALMEGVVRNAGTHAAGVIITDKPVIEYLPLHRPTGQTAEESPIKTVTQFELNTLEALGLLKVDYLGLDTLTIMARACDLIRERQGQDFDLNNIPTDDPATYELMGRGETAGVFQVEGCLSGDTYIGHRTIKELFQDFTARQAVGTLSGRRLLRAHSCYLDEGRFGANQIVKAVYSGVKPVYRLIASNHCWIKTTADHHFLTQRGWVRLGEIDPQSDRLLVKKNISRAGRICADCGAVMKSVEQRARRCNRCASHLTANPSRPEVKQCISQSKIGHIPWNKGLTAETAADTLWIKNLSKYNETQKGVSLEQKLGPERAAIIKAKLSEHSSGKNNPMYGRPPKETKTYTKAGYREDLGHYVRSSWEADLARVFRYLGWEYQYEPRTFELTAPEGKALTYTPDFYVPGTDTWYEVKGWMDKASAKKIALFQQQYPDCALIVVDKTLFAEFQLQYVDMVAWECPQTPDDTEWAEICSIELVGEEETYDLQMLSPGNNFVANGFVVHNSGMRRYLMQMKPKELANVIAMVALFRPGPMDFIPGYIRRMHGEEKVEYRHPALVPIFEETYGYPVYQEQLMSAVMQLAGYSAPEADDLRRAVAKKIKDKLLKHREKFVKGAVKSGIPEQTADAIFSDWEEFARYGFNKSHAADYGVIAVQTAYLKVHYPVEYMTASLSVKKSDTSKVAYYVADCRRMGIAVEPPNVNISGWDFTIEDRPPSPAIRFGLGAVKNVGQGAVETILQARQQMGIFTSINDFAHRVDLRQVGKRTLESLVKVGALDAFSSRPALLESLDRILSVSGAHFRASEKGQISMFGAHTGVVEEITLPKVAVEVTRREQLDWERELIGLYVSDHPLNPVMDTLNEIVTHFSGQLSEAGPNERVRVAGLITRIRPHQTKAGKAMGFVTIEDVQGAIELILFPNTWEKYSSLVDFDKIILAEGRPDAERGEAKVLVDRISTELKVMSAVGEPPSQVKEMAAPYKPGRLTAKPVKTPPKPKPAPAGDTTHPSARRVAETSPSIPEPPPPNGKDTRVPPASAPPKVVQKGKPIPPPPDSFPPDWSLASAIMDAVAEPDLAIASARAIVEPEQPPVDFPPDVEEPPPYPLPALESSIEKNAYPPPEIAPALESKAELSKPRTETPGALTPVLTNLPIVTSYIVPPAETAEGETVYMVTLILRPTADAVRDQVRIRQIYGTLIAYPGKDRFAFQVFENGRGFLIEFPNFTTHVCPEMLNRLKAFIAPENVRVEPITFQ